MGDALKGNVAAKSYFVAGMLGMLVGVAFGIPTPGFSQGAYPIKPAKILVGFSAGGFTDFAARIAAEGLSAELDGSFVVENRTGGSSNIAAAAAARSPNDGYTILLATNVNTMNVSLFKQLSFDFAKDFAPISLLTSTPLILLVRSDFKATNMKDFIQLAKSSVDSFRIATGGPGSASDFAVKMLNQKAGVTLSGVPYRGSTEGLADVLGGRIEGIFAPPSTALPHVNAGALRALGISSARRSEIAPEIPTMVESGLLGYELSIWNGLLVPTGTPAAIIDQLAAAARRAFEFRPNKAKIAAQGADVSLLGPAEFRAYINEEIIRWAELAHATDMKPQ